MAGLEQEDDFFSDDDIDTLPQNALEELEQNALLHTQHQTQATLILENPRSSDYGDGLADDDLDDAVVIDKAQNGSDRLQSLHPRISDPLAQRDNIWQNRYGGQSNNNPVLEQLSSQQLPSQVSQQQLSSQQSNSARRLPQPHEAEQITNDGVLTPQPVNVSKQIETDFTVGALQQKIQELLQERESLKADINTKAGEIAIVRRNQEKAAKDHERELIAFKKISREKLAAQQKAIEIARDAEKNSATELEFVKRDLVEETEKVRNLRKSKEKQKEAVGEPATPKKTKSLPYRDGFDDEEIQIISPSKFHLRKSNPATPTKLGTKRKRKGPESPVVPLEVEQSNPTQEGQEPIPTAISDLLLEKLSKSDDHLSFLEIILDHRPCRNHLRTIEEFAKLAFPTTPQESFASMIFSKLPGLSKQSLADFPIKFCELLVSLWKRCLVEKYYNPISLLIDLLTFCIELKTLTISPVIIETLLPVAQETGGLIAWRRFHRQSFTEFENFIDVSACLAVIYLTALGCMNDRGHINRFWRHMQLEFVLVILSQNQLLEDFDMMLQLLVLSVTQDSVGPIVTDPELQVEQARYIINRVTFIMVNSPTIPEGSPKHSSRAISALRLQALKTLYAFCLTPWAGEVIAVHQTAVDNLVKLMSEELDNVYDHRSGHKESGRIVSLAMRLLHYLTTKHEKVINMQEKLSRIHGGNQKYLICLARLNFSEDDLILSANIDPEVAECAHEMLELAVTPEEGDAIHIAFTSS